MKASGERYRPLREPARFLNAGFIRRSFAGDSAGRARFQMLAREAAGSDVLLLDPDTGIARDGARVSSAVADGYLYWDEIDQLFRTGCSLLIYRHYPRGGAARIDGCSKMQSHVADARVRVGAPYVATLGLSTTALLLLGQERHTATLDLVLRRIEWQWRDKMVICKHHRVSPAAINTHRSTGLEPLRS